MLVQQLLKWHVQCIVLGVLHPTAAAAAAVCPMLCTVLLPTAACGGSRPRPHVLLSLLLPLLLQQWQLYCCHQAVQPAQGLPGSLNAARGKHFTNLWPAATRVLHKTGMLLSKGMLI